MILVSDEKGHFRLFGALFAEFVDVLALPQGELEQARFERVANFFDVPFSGSYFRGVAQNGDLHQSAVLRLRQFFGGLAPQK